MAEKAKVETTSSVRENWRQAVKSADFKMVWRWCARPCALSSAGTGAAQSSTGVPSSPRAVSTSGLPACQLGLVLEIQARTVEDMKTEAVTGGVGV